MKRHNYLWQAVSSFENLLLAARTAERGKRFRDNVLEFNYHLEPELTKLQQELTQKTYRPGAYRTFRIFEPKPRLISAAPYRDRVVHHAVCNRPVGK
jgi:RNA-directed DNA polymerase